MPETNDLRHVAPVRAELGESPVWDAQRRRLYFVDIQGGRIQALDADGQVHTCHQSTSRVGALALTVTGDLIFTEGASVALLDLQRGQVIKRTQPVHDVPRYRFNDGACDPQGRFVTGLMDEGPSRETGVLYLFDTDLNAQVLHQGLALPNGLAWSADGHTLFFVDSVAQTIFRAAYGARGTLGEITRFVQTPPELGRPDGIALDTEGGLWVCQFNGGCLLRYDRDGRLTERIDLPVPRPTSCCFGGDGLATLYITTARIGMTVAQLADYPQAGDLYAVRPAVPGVARHAFVS